MSKLLVNILSIKFLNELVIIIYSFFFSPGKLQVASPLPEQPVRIHAGLHQRTGFPGRGAGQDQEAGLEWPHGGPTWCPQAVRGQDRRVLLLLQTIESVWFLHFFCVTSSWLKTLIVSRSRNVMSCNKPPLIWSPSELQEQQSLVPRERGEQIPGWRRQTRRTEAPGQRHHTGACPHRDTEPFNLHPTPRISNQFEHQM